MRTWLERLRPVALVVGLVAMGFALRGAVRGVDELGWPSPTACVVAVVLCALAIGAAGVGWSRVVLEHADVRVAHGFVVAQAAKYVPGGVWQAVGQIDTAVRAGVAPRVATVMFAAFSATFVLTAGAVGIAVAATDATDAVRWAAALVGVAALVVLASPLGDAVMAKVTRGMLSHTTGGVSVLLAVYFVLQGLALTVLARDLTGDWIWAHVPAYAIAWAVGFLAVPVPAGVGVREAMLLVVLRGVVDDDAVFATAVLLRVATILGELLAITIGGVWLRVRARHPRVGDLSPEA